MKTVIINSNGKKLEMRYGHQNGNVTLLQDGKLAGQQTSEQCDKAADRARAAGCVVEVIENCNLPR